MGLIGGFLGMENIDNIDVDEPVANSDICAVDDEDEVRKEENAVIKGLTAELWDHGDLSDEAIQKLQSFVDGGNGYACYQLAKYYLFHDEDYKKATPYIQSGIKNGSLGCYAVLGKAYEKGIGVERDFDKARQIYEYLSSGENENAFAIYALADMMYHGKGCKADKEGAFKLFFKLACDGLPKAKHRVGLMYQKGTGTEIDFEQALYWYKSAALDNYQKAYTSLGVMHYAGMGTDIDPEEALKWFALGAKNHDKIALYYLGKCAYRGNGTEKNVKKAINLLVRADKKGDIKAKSYLEEVVGYFKSEKLENQSIKDFFENQMVA